MRNDVRKNDYICGLCTQKQYTPQVYAIMIKKKNFKDFFVMINTSDFSIRVSSSISTVASITKTHRNTIAKMPCRASFKDFLVIKTTEE